MRYSSDGLEVAAHRGPRQRHLVMRHKRKSHLYNARSHIYRTALAITPRTQTSQGYCLAQSTTSIVWSKAQRLHPTCCKLAHPRSCDAATNRESRPRHKPPVGDCCGWLSDTNTIQPIKVSVILHSTAQQQPYALRVLSGRERT